MLFKTARAPISQFMSTETIKVLGTPPSKQAARRSLAMQPDHWYMDVWAVSAYEKFGLNDNADGFESKELKLAFPTFIGSWACLDHQNYDEKLSIGRNIDAVYTPDDYVRIAMGVNRIKGEQRHPGLEQKIVDGQITDTSMGATLPGTWVTMHDGTSKIIEDVGIGDRVLTSRGTVEKVIQVHRAIQKKRVYYLKVAGLQQELPLTEEHPVWCMSDWAVKSVLGYGEFKEAKDLAVGMWALTPKLLPSVVNSPYSPDWARLLGWYLGDGFVIGGSKPYGIGFVLGNHEEFRIEELVRLVRSVGQNPVVKKRGDGNGFEVHIYKKTFYEEVVRLAGRSAKHKKIDEEVMLWPVEMQRLLIGYYLDADGCFEETSGESHISTSNYQLARQIETVLLRLGVRSVLRENTRKPGKSGFTIRERIEYQLDIGKQDAQLLLGCSFKIKKQSIGKKRNDRWLRADGLYAKIVNIREEDYEGVCLDISVEGPHTYVGNNIAIHNCICRESMCTICANVASDPSQYCDHVSMHRGESIVSAETNWEPIVAGELNRGVVFFEDSIITSSEGADNNAKILAKLAGIHSPIASGYHIPANKLFKVFKQLQASSSPEVRAALALVLEHLNREI